MPLDSNNNDDTTDYFNDPTARLVQKKVLKDLINSNLWPHIYTRNAHKI